MTHLFIEIWNSISSRKSCLWFRFLSGCSSLRTECRNILKKAWWCKHMGMNVSRTAPLDVRKAASAKIVKIISPKYPTNVDWSHGNLQISDWINQGFILNMFWNQSYDIESFVVALLTWIEMEQKHVPHQIVHPYVTNQNWCNRYQCSDGNVCFGNSEIYFPQPFGCVVGLCQETKWLVIFVWNWIEFQWAR